MWVTKSIVDSGGKLDVGSSNPNCVALSLVFPFPRSFFSFPRREPQQPENKFEEPFPDILLFPHNKRYREAAGRVVEVVGIIVDVEVDATRSVARGLN
jgi:hypothetical protein